MSLSRNRNEAITYLHKMLSLFRGRKGDPPKVSGSESSPYMEVDIFFIDLELDAFVLVLILRLMH